jgi:hypothetical protein
VLNSGHRRGGHVTRTVGDDHEPRQFSTWAPAAIAMIGRLPDTLHDRSIVIGLRRRKPSERIESFRADRAEHLKLLQRKTARWAQDASIQLTGSDPDMGALINRTADNWRPLFAIADQAGGDWPSRVREAAKASVKAVTEDSITEQLLGDIKWIFDDRPESNNNRVSVDRIASSDLVKCLTGMEDRPWAEYKGKGLTQNSLARLLNSFGIFSGTIRLAGDKTAKGYYRHQFDDPFERYLAPQPVTTSQPKTDDNCDGSQSVTQGKTVTPPQTSQVNDDAHCDGVTPSSPPGEDGTESIDL